MCGTVDVVTSLCADEMTGVSTTSTSESKVCKARPGPSTRTTTGNSMSSSARSARKRTRSRRRCLQARPRLARSRVNSTTSTSRALQAAKTTPSTPASAQSVHLAGKRRQQRNRERNSWRAMMEILPIRQWYTWFRNRFGGCLRRTVATKHCIR